MNLGPGKRIVVINGFDEFREAIKTGAFDLRPPFLNRDNVELRHGTDGTDSRGVLFSNGREWEEQRRFIAKSLKDFGYGKSMMEDVIVNVGVQIVENLNKSELPSSLHYRGFRKTADSAYVMATDTKIHFKFRNTSGYKSHWLLWPFNIEPEAATISGVCCGTYCPEYSYVNGPNVGLIASDDVIHMADIGSEVGSITILWKLISGVDLELSSPRLKVSFIYKIGS